MKTRSKSVPKILFKDNLFANNSKAQLAHDLVSGRLYGQKYIRVNSKLHFLNICDLKNNKVLLQHSHTNKKFESIAQSSPSSKLKKLKAARLFNPKKSLEESCSKQSIFTAKEISLSRQEKSSDIFQSVAKLLTKEKENTSKIEKFSKNCCGAIKLKIKNISKSIMKLQNERFAFPEPHRMYRLRS